MSEIKYPDHLNKFIDALRKKGVKSIKIEGLDLELYEEAPPSNYKRKLEVVGSDKPETKLDDDDMLLWSVDQGEANA